MMAYKKKNHSDRIIIAIICYVYICYNKWLLYNRFSSLEVHRGKSHWQVIFIYMDLRMKKSRFLWKLSYFYFWHIISWSSNVMWCQHFIYNPFEFLMQWIYVLNENLVQCDMEDHDQIKYFYLYDIIPNWSIWQICCPIIPPLNMTTFNNFLRTKQ